MNEEILSQEHMLSQQEISELETSDCHTLVEEMHGTYGLQVIRRAYTSRTGWGHDIEVEYGGGSGVATYIMGKNNIPLCVLKIHLIEKFILLNLVKTLKKEGTLVLLTHINCLLS